METIYRVKCKTHLNFWERNYHDKIYVGGVFKRRVEAEVYIHLLREEILEGFYPNKVTRVSPHLTHFYFRTILDFKPYHFYPVKKWVRENPVLGYYDFEIEARVIP